MFQNRGEKAVVAVTGTILIFMVLTAVVAGWPKASSALDKGQSAKQAVFSYYEHMPDDSYKIPEADLKKLVDADNQDIYILDIREAKDFAKGHIKGAHNIAFKDVGKNLDKLPLDKTIIVYCYTGQTGGQTTAALNIAGIKARSLNGGMNNGWLKAGYPVVKD